MKLVTPRAIHIAQTEVDELGLADYLAEIGAPEWQTDAPSGAEKLIEVAGRMCYRSFAIGLNPNVTKVREGNAAYLANVERQRHGSLFENATDTYVLFDVSRIVTHQLVRHRAGTAWAQESGHNAWAYIEAHAVSLIYTLFISSMLFWIWWRAPYILTAWGLNVARYFPLTLATAGLYGVVSDKVVSYLLTKFNKMLPAEKENN